MPNNNGARRNQDDSDRFLAVMAGTALFGFVAYLLSLFLRTPFGPQFSLDANAFLLGVITTLPLVIFLWWFSNTRIGYIAAFRRSQIEFFANLGFAFTPWRIVLMALSAGFAEELLFRGVLQTWLNGFLPVTTAIIASNVVFGLLHMRTALYALIAGMVGVYLGALYAVTGNLLTPIITHIIYDAVALEYTRRAIDEYRQAQLR